LEERINLWSVQTLLPLIDGSLKFLESKLGHRAQAHVLKPNEITKRIAAQKGHWLGGMKYSLQ
jgi:hypothetical protein